MILLDSDHLTVLGAKASTRRDHLVSRMSSCTDPVIGTTIVNIEEQMRGWLASIAKERLPSRQIKAYRELEKLFDFFSEYHIASFDANAVVQFEPIRNLRIGTMDLKIAAIVLSNDATLLTANRRNFEKVPGLRFENWWTD